jgi:cytochrome c5
MIMNSKRISLAFLLLASSVALAQTVKQDQPVSTQANKNHPPAHVAQQHEDEGTRIFQQNCSRCHNAPEGFSPRISETVVRHMSVRASLSMRDKAELLRFLNP